MATFFTHGGLLRVLDLRVSHPTLVARSWPPGPGRAGEARGQHDAASGRQVTPEGRRGTSAPPARSPQSGFLRLFPLFILTSLTPFPASPKFTNTWRSPEVIHSPSPSPRLRSKDKGIPF
jgi:hypothetical protein